MPLTTRRQEIDHHTLKLIVGSISISMAVLTSYFADSAITSISASYYEGGWSQSIFVGFLFAVAAFLLAYNGLSQSEMVLSKVASLSALGVAMFPCKCDDHPEVLPFVHGISAAVMFMILAFFCLTFFQRARRKGHTQAMARAVIYAFCAGAIVLAILVILTDNLMGGRLSSSVPRLTFYGEATGLIAFGISWLTASRVLPLITHKTERISLFGDQVPD